MDTIKKKKKVNMDRKLIAAKEHHEAEVKYVAHRYKIPIAKVRQAMKECGKNGKPARSKFVIYTKLREWGFKIETRYKKVDGSLK